MTEGLLITSIGIGLVLAVMAPFYRRHRRRERRTDLAVSAALRHGLQEPVSLHPVVDTDTCIGIGNCVAACPEDDVLGLRDGQARPVSPARCIGHGLCERACPVDAIRLVFGTERRGVELPRIKANFETNVPGIYIVGELGGMGLIRNAFEQGRQCIDGITREGRRGASDALDLVVVGCGPAGLAASLYALAGRLRFRTLEREDDVGGAVRYYPRKKVVMTAPVKVPGYGKLSFREIRKEELIDVWSDILDVTGLEVTLGETVTHVQPAPGGGFVVATRTGSYRTARVILAIGRRGIPRKLNLPGEKLPKVIYSLREPEAYQRERIVVVGGGDSAIEAALALAEQPGNDVKISYRREKFARIKPANQGRLEEALTRGAVEVLWRSNLLEIRSDAVVYRDDCDAVRTLPNDLVAIFAGGELPTEFLKACGIAIDTKFGEPRG